jgi:hypothetical protein
METDLLSGAKLTCIEKAWLHIHHGLKGNVKRKYQEPVQFGLAGHDSVRGN